MNGPLLHAAESLVTLKNMKKSYFYIIVVNVSVQKVYLLSVFNIMQSKWPCSHFEMLAGNVCLIHEF